MAEVQKKQKGGSERRQATERVTFRLTPDQKRQLDEWADAAGITRSSYVIGKTFAGPPLRLTRVPPVDRQALGQFLAQLGRLNGNVYQISRAANFRETFALDALMKALKEIQELRNAVLAAMGRVVR